MAMYTPVTNKLYPSFLAFSCSLLNLEIIEENQPIKREIYTKYPGLKFYCDISFEEQMKLLTPDVLDEIYTIVKTIYYKHRANKSKFDTDLCFLHEVLTHEKFGIFTMMKTGLPIKIVVEFTKIEGYVNKCIRNRALKIAMEYTKIIYIHTDNDDIFSENSLYDAPKNPMEELEEQDNSSIHEDLKIIPSHTYLKHIINLNADIKTNEANLYYTFLSKTATLLKHDTFESLLPSTTNKITPFLMLYHPQLFQERLFSLIEIQQTFLRPHAAIILHWQETTEIRNNLKSNNCDFENECDVSKNYRNYLTWLCYSTTDTYNENIKYPQVHRDTLGKNALRCNGDICIAMLISLIIGMIEPDIFSCHFDYPVEYKEMLTKMFAKAKISLLSLKDVTDDDFLLRVKYFHRLLRIPKYTEALQRLELAIYKDHHMKIDTTANFQTRFEETKSAIKRLQKTDADVERLLVELTRIFYSKDNQQYHDFLNQTSKSVVSRFLTKYLQFMLCITY